MPSTDGLHRELCHRLFDAIETGDLATVEECFAPDMAMWFNVTNGTSTLEETLAALANGYEIQRRRTYNDRKISTFGDGFVAQYTLNVVLNDGARATLSACVVGQVQGGRIARLDEYLDSSHFRTTGGRARAGAGSR